MTPTDAATLYHSLGWSLIPIVPETKKSALPWTEFQTRRAPLAEVKGWLAQSWWLAVVTGEISGVVVIDDDRVKHKLNEWGFESSVVAVTKSGGKHFYFRYDRELHSHCNTKLHLDIKAWHSYCLLPPFNGRSWLSSPSDKNVNMLVSIPDGIVRLVNSDKVDGKQSRDPLRMSNFINIKDGARTENLHRLACSVFNHMDRDDGRRILVGVNQTYSPPLGASEFEYQISRAWEFVQDHPKQKPEITAPHREKLIVNTGIPSLDEILHGFYTGGCYIVGGEEKSGKTSLILNFVKNFVESGYRVFYSSTELKEDDVQDYLDSISGQPGWANPNFQFYDLESGTLAEHLKILESELTSGTRIAVIDNLTSYRDHSDLGRDEWMRISQAGDGYRRLARKWNAMILMVVHLNQGTRLNEIPRSVKELLQKRQAEKIFEESVSIYRKPTKDDLKGGSGYRSQTLGQLLIWRPYQGFYSTDLNKLCAVIVENNRHGPTGEVRLTFDGLTKKFGEDTAF